MALEIADQVEAILRDYNEEARKALEDAAKEAAKSTSRMVKASAGALFGSGRYAKGWGTTRRSRAGHISYFVNNKTDYQLTHLLEKGHIKANGYGTYSGRVAGRPHIAPAERLGIKLYEQKVKERLK